MFAVGLAPSPPMLRPAAHSCHCRRDGNLTLCGSGLRGSRIGPAGTQPTALRSISGDLDPDQSE